VPAARTPATRATSRRDRRPRTRSSSSLASAPPFGSWFAAVVATIAASFDSHPRRRDRHAAGSPGPYTARRRLLKLTLRRIRGRSATGRTGGLFGCAAKARGNRASASIVVPVQPRLVRLDVGGVEDREQSLAHQLRRAQDLSRVPSARVHDTGGPDSGARLQAALSAVGKLLLAQLVLPVRTAAARRE